MIRYGIVLLLLCAALLPGATLDPVGDMGFEEDQRPYSLTLTGIAAAVPGQRVLVTASFADSGLFAPPSVIHDGYSTTATLVITTLLDANGSTRLTVTVAADDGSATGSPTDRISLTSDVQLEATNDQPTLTRPPLLVIFEDESDPTRLTVRIGGISPGRPTDEAGQQLTIIAAPVDTDLLTVESISYVQGERIAWMHVRPNPDRWGPTTIVVTAFDDGLSGFSDQNAISRTMSVYVTPVDDPPVLAAHRDLVPTPGNSVAITSADLLLMDADVPAASTLAFTLTTAPAGELRRDGLALAVGDSFTQVDITAGRMTYQHGDTGTETFSLTYTDGTLATPLGPVTIYVTPVGMTRPEILLSADTITFTEDGTPAAILGSVQDVHTPVFQGGSLAVALSSGSRTGDRLDLAEQGSGPGQVHLAGNQVEVGGLAVGTLASSGDGLSLTVSFTTANASPATATAVLRAVRFSSSSQDPGSQVRTIRAVANNGVATSSDPALVSVVVVPVDDPPVITTTWVATVPGVAAPWTLAVDDPDSPALTWSVVTQPTGGLVSVLDAAAGRFLVAGSHAGTFEVAVADASTSVTASIALEVTDPGATAPLPASDPPHEAFAGTTLEHALAFDRVSGPLTLLLTGDAPAGTTVRAVGASGGMLSWDVPADEPTATFRRFGILAVDQASHHLGYWPMTLLIHPDPAGDL